MKTWMKNFSQHAWSLLFKLRQKHKNIVAIEYLILWTLFAYVIHDVISWHFHFYASILSLSLTFAFSQKLRYKNLHFQHLLELKWMKGHYLIFIFMISHWHIFLLTFSFPNSKCNLSNNIHPELSSDASYIWNCYSWILTRKHFFEIFLGISTNWIYFTNKNKKIILKSMYRYFWVLFNILHILYCILHQINQTSINNQKQEKYLWNKCNTSFDNFSNKLKLDFILIRQKQGKKIVSGCLATILEYLFKT